MAPASRFGTGLLGTFGIALAALMAYTLAFEGDQDSTSTSTPEAAGAASEVAVFFPDRRDWTYFRQAVDACVARGLAKPVDGDEESIVVRTLGKGRLVRFTWESVRGVGEIGDAARRLAASESPPVAVVGSSTTVLTFALARSVAGRGPESPNLLIPWGTTVAGPGSPPLLDINKGRTFRFCPNNRQLAESVVDCLVEQDGKPPGRVFLVVDPHDPYSVDLAGYFRLAIEARMPSSVIDERPDTLGAPTIARSPGSVLVPSAEESTMADEAWTSAEERPTWVVLPLQGDPARRMIAALQRRASWHVGGKDDGPLRVVCGDGIGRETLDDLAGHRPFPVWCASTSSTRTPDHGVSNDSQTLAEVVSSLLLAIDAAPSPKPTSDEVRDGLARTDLKAADRPAFGRALSFEPGGERRGDPGHVLAVRPGSPNVAEFDREADGRWRPR